MMATLYHLANLGLYIVIVSVCMMVGGAAAELGAALGVFMGMVFVGDVMPRLAKRFAAIEHKRRNRREVNRHG